MVKGCISAVKLDLSYYWIVVLPLAHYHTE